MSTMTNSLNATFGGKRVLLTGHTGFKGTWMAEWLIALGSNVTGYSLPPPTQPSLFHSAAMEKRLQHIEGDVRDAARLRDVISAGEFDFVFHLAAQPIVRVSYADPTGTFETNVMGTINTLEAVRRAARVCVVVVITTDKCYENREWLHGYREEDPLGGHDPYSASKAAAEIAVSAWRRSFFSPDKGMLVATARAGNVIGPGDWAADRIVPDCIRALQGGRPIPVRNKVSTRPWQHVLEPLGGYLLLAAQLAASRENGDKNRAARLASAFNFGPPLSSNRTVADLVGEVLKHWPGTWEDRSDPNAPHEAGKLNLTTDKAFHLLGWRARWDFAATIAHTIRVYRELSAAPSGKDVHQLLLREIASYSTCFTDPINVHEHTG